MNWTVYGVFYAQDYEGSNLLKLFKSKDKAKDFQATYAFTEASERGYEESEVDSDHGVICFGLTKVYIKELEVE